MIWSEPINHGDDYYYCSCNVQDFNSKNKKSITYPTNIMSAIRPIEHVPDVPIPNPKDHVYEASSSSNNEINTERKEMEDSDFQANISKELELFTQSELK
ncbi:UNVERIFIED_CONTAM: hypothetical protein RMT77_004534 [Armadillidium vulgare]